MMTEYKEYLESYTTWTTQEYQVRLMSMPANAIAYRYNRFTSVANAYSIHSIRDYYELITRLSGFIDNEAIVKRIIKRYIGDEEDADKLIRIIKSVVDLRKLAALLQWLESQLQHHITGLDVMQVEDGGVFVIVELEGCGWDEWGELAKKVKKRLVEEGFEDVARRVLLVCKGALRGSKS